MARNGNRAQIYQTLIAYLLTWKTKADGLVGVPLASEDFTICGGREAQHSGFNLLTAWHDLCP
jgi:hypothetical protein